MWWHGLRNIRVSRSTYRQVGSDKTTLTWIREGVMKSSAKLLSPSMETIATYLRKNSFFSHKTSAEWQSVSYIFNYDVSLHDNVNIFDSSKNKIGKYEESLGYEAGTISDLKANRKYDYSRTDPFKYHYELKFRDNLMAEIEILEQKASYSSGTMLIYLAWEEIDILPLCTSLHLVMNN